MQSEHEMSTPELLKQVTEQVALLAKKQIDLARTELKSDLKAEVAMAAGLGVAALGSIVSVTLLLVTAIFALAQWLPGWQAGLLVSGFTLTVTAIAALVGWNKRVRTPLEKTRKTLKEDAQWTKEQLS